MDKVQITFVKPKGFAAAGYTAWYPKADADALIESGFAKPTETKVTRHLTKVDKTSTGGKIREVSKDKGND